VNRADLAPGDAIALERVSKAYRLGGGPRLLFRGAHDDAEDPDDEIDPGPLGAEEEHEHDGDGRVVWAIRDVSMTIPRGATLGLVGANGAGKTTLLKLLARITPPTEGRILVRGRVAPLIEVASAFMQPDLSIRENVLLMARLFGVPRQTALKRLTEIVDFAEIARFERTKTKRLSGGLFRRLAFATALHLDPDVLLADEILGVGDAEFRRRCIERVERAATAGLTVIFASHDLEAITRMCRQTAWLKEGRIVAHGETSEILARYESHAEGAEPEARPEVPDVYGLPPRPPAPAAPAAPPAKRRSFNEHVAIQAAGVFMADGSRVETLHVDEAAEIRFRLEVATPDIQLQLGVGLNASKWVAVRIVQGGWIRASAAGTYEVSVPLPAGLLGDYFYVGRVGAFVEADGERSTVAKQEAFTLQGHGAGETEDPDGRQLFHELDLPWRVELLKPWDAGARRLGDADKLSL
jgi:ABC-type polysaccharide/polyol phosphate transport system ATPase subunit